jgi:UDP-glucose 4-epimerase
MDGTFVTAHGVSGWSGVKVLVTGASGFIGSHLCRVLERAGAQVHGLSRQARVSDHMQWWCADACDEQALADLFQRVSPQVVYHLSTHGGGGPHLELVMPSLRDDLITTVNVLKACTNSSCERVVLVASLEEPDSPEKVPATPYAAAKWAATMYGRMFQRLYRTPVVLARVYMAYGPGQPAHKLVPFVGRSLLQRQAPQLNSGTREVDWVYIDDVINGLVRVGRVPELEGHLVELGSGSLVSIRDMVLKIAQAVNNGVEPVFALSSDRPMEQVRVADLEASAKLLGWHPRISLDDGIAMTVQALRDQLQPLP